MIEAEDWIRNDYASARSSPRKWAEDYVLPVQPLQSVLRAEPMDALECVSAANGAADCFSRGPLRFSVTVAKNADAEVGLAYVEEDAGLKVTGCKGALQAAVESGAPRVLRGDRLVDVDGVAGSPMALRGALRAARTSAGAAVLVLERTQEVLEEELMEAINTRDWPRVSQGLQDFRAGGWSVPTALLAGLLRLAHEIGEGPSALAALDSINLSARALSEVLTMDALARDDVLAAAGQILGMRRDGHPIPMELAAQFCSTGLRVGRLQEVLPVLPLLGLGPEEFLVLLKICQAHDQDPTARFLQLYECCIVHQDRLLSARAPVQRPADDHLVDWLSRRVVAQVDRMARAHGQLLSRVCFLSWAAVSRQDVSDIETCTYPEPILSIPDMESCACPEPSNDPFCIVWEDSRKGSSATASTTDSKANSESSSEDGSRSVEEPVGDLRTMKRSSKVRRFESSKLGPDPAEEPFEPIFTEAVPTKALRPTVSAHARFTYPSPEPVIRAPGLDSASRGRLPAFVPPPKTVAPKPSVYAPRCFSPGPRTQMIQPPRAAQGLQSCALRAHDHQSLEGMPRSSTPFVRVPTRGASVVTRFSK